MVPFKLFVLLNWVFRIHVYTINIENLDGQLLIGPIRTQCRPNSTTILFWKCTQNENHFPIHTKSKSSMYILFNLLGEILLWIISLKFPRIILFHLKSSMINLLSEQWSKWVWDANLPKRILPREGGDIGLFITLA